MGEDRTTVLAWPEDNFRPESGLWVSKDIVFTANDVYHDRIRGHINTEIIPHALLEELVSGDPGFFFSTRSRFMQAGIAPVHFRKTGDSVKVDLVSLSGLPITQVPEHFLLGRFFVCDSSRRLQGNELNHAVRSIGTGEPAGNDLVLPVVKGWEITAGELDLEGIIAAETRKELDQILSLEETRQAVHLPFFLGETQPVQVPEDVTLVIDPRYQEQEGTHLPSVIIDPGFRGPVRVEAISRGLGQVRAWVFKT